MSRIFNALEDVSTTINSSVNISVTNEDEVTIYGTITDPSGLNECVSKCIHTDYSIRVDDLNKIRLRIIVADNNVTNELTFKQKNKEGNSTEYTIHVDDSLVEYFKLLSEPTRYTRYVYSSSQVTFNYLDEEGNSNIIELPNVRYEVDVFDTARDLCKIEVELQEIKRIIKDSTIGYQGDIKLLIKVSHLPFKPIEVYGLDKNDSRIKGFWDRVKSKEDES